VVGEGAPSAADLIQRLLELEQKVVAELDSLSRLAAGPS